MFVYDESCDDEHTIFAEFPYVDHKTSFLKLNSFV